MSLNALNDNLTASCNLYINLHFSYFRYIIPYRNTAKTVVLHCQPDHSLCRNLLPFHSGILFALSGKKSHYLNNIVAQALKIP